MAEVIQKAAAPKRSGVALGPNKVQGVVSQRPKRTAAVQGYIRSVLDTAPPGPIRVVSMCAGEGRDLLGVLADHQRQIRIAGHRQRAFERVQRRAHVHDVAAGVEHRQALLHLAGQQRVELALALVSAAPAGGHGSSAPPRPVSAAMRARSFSPLSPSARALRTARPAISIRRAVALKNSSSAESSPR